MNKLMTKNHLATSSNRHGKPTNNHAARKALRHAKRRDGDETRKIVCDAATS